MAQHNNTNTNPTKSNQAHSTSNNEEIKPDNPKKQFIPKFIPKNERLRLDRSRQNGSEKIKTSYFFFIKE